MTAVTACMGTWSTMACNIGDFSRYSRKESSAILQIAIVPLMWTVCALFGSIAANMTTVIPVFAGAQVFQPFDIIDQGGWLGNKGGRAAAFFCSAAWAIGNMTTNITANSVSSANDLASLFPKWINIFRGQLFAIIIGCWAFAPWKVLSSATSFLSFMSSYSIVLAPNFFLVKKGRYNVPEMYDFTGIYRYTHGFNLPALGALLVSIPPNLPGMINALNSSIDIGNAKYIYCMADIFGIVVAAATHVTLSKLFPARETLISEAVFAHDVLEGRVAGYEHLARRHGGAGTTSFAASDEKKLDDAPEANIVSV
ncbi:SPOSA6832_04165 [Sporobolomyces salmonicolor]|uniref:SPOSA6832_04165-mRNA-1:cds n=1 Tax=Sporidiobolus salmonicolor TaxID=5005 RepID=A0A0D6ERE0_SPOSA|nr:SPOSA6832_04165 [Sporobolomyces salmonicolor]